MYGLYLVGNLWALGGLSPLCKEKEGCRQNNEQRDDDSLKVSHGEEHELLFEIPDFSYKEKLGKREGGNRRAGGI